MLMVIFIGEAKLHAVKKKKTKRKLMKTPSNLANKICFKIFKISSYLLESLNALIIIFKRNKTETSPPRINNIVVRLYPNLKSALHS